MYSIIYYDGEYCSSDKKCGKHALDIFRYYIFTRYFCSKIIQICWQQWLFG